MRKFNIALLFLQDEIQFVFHELSFLGNLQSNKIFLVADFPKSVSGSLYLGTTAFPLVNL